MFLDSLQYGIPLFVIFQFLSIAKLRGQSSSHRDLTANFFIAIVAFPLAAHGVLMLSNGYLDTAPATTHLTDVITKHYTTSKDSKTYYVELTSWRPDRSSEEITIDADTYNGIDTIDDQMAVTTRPGYHGYEVDRTIFPGIALTLDRPPTTNPQAPQRHLGWHVGRRYRCDGHLPPTASPESRERPV